MSMYRNAVLHARGVREYTRDGYLYHKKKFIAADLDVDLTDKVFLITGGNGGIGKCIATEIARRVGIVHLICRDSKKGDHTRKEIVETTGNPNVHVHIVDLSSPRSIIKFTKMFMEKHLIVDVLVHTASCMLLDKEETTDNLDKVFSTNVLGVHILTTELLPLLLRSNEPRVIMVVTGSLLSQKLNIADLQFDKMQPYDGESAYAQTKRQLVTMTEQYSVLFPKVKFWSYNPGWLDTPTIQNSMAEFYTKMKDKLRTIEEGADTGVWLAVSQAVAQLPSSLFFQDRRPVGKHLPLAWTKSTKDEESALINELDNIAERFYEKKMSDDIVLNTE
ncbi:Dehydrogenase/reductase SDR member 12 [Chamberlinius hualienensis]